METKSTKIRKPVNKFIKGSYYQKKSFFDIDLSDARKGDIIFVDEKYIKTHTVKLNK